jgi:diguanylate cyclase (GGDEF)-like protein
VKRHLDTSTSSGRNSFHLATAVFSITPDGMIEECNPAAEALLLGPGAEGARLADRLTMAEKLGRIAPGTANKVEACISGSAIAFELADGRIVSVSVTDLQGRTLVECADVTAYAEALVSPDHDPLTGLLTHSAMWRELSDVLDADKPAAVLYVGLERVTDVTDMLGHEVGDMLIKRVADRIAGHAGAGGQIARTGHEFILLKQGHGEDLGLLARRLADLIERPFLIQGRTIHIGACVGIAEPDGAAEEAEALLRNAHVALKAARSEGSGTTLSFSAEMRERLARRRLLEKDLRQALALREFSLAYQPQYEVEGRRLVGFEALLRWTHPERGPVSPAEFIPLAEELGLIVAIGEWTLRTACKEAAAWGSSLPISVNISPLQFRDPNIVSTVMSALAFSGLEPSRLELEVTEGALLLNQEPVLAIFRQLKELGVHFAMDDFGTGYSSLSYLQKFPFDKIKIDQSFVRNLPNSQDGIAIVRAISALGQSLGLSIIAEGVETEEQLSCVHQNGCRQVQGYLTGRPLDRKSARMLAAGEQQKEESV